MKKINCWEFKKCGRQPGGENVAELGVCRAAIEIRADGLNEGKNGGRCCWAISGTLCRGKVQGIFAAKITSCIRCDFFHLVEEEEGRNMANEEEIIASLKPPKEK